MPMDDYECSSCGLSFERFVHRREDRDAVLCPHCQSETRRIFTKVTIIPDTVPGGFDIENLDRHVRHFESKSQYRDELKARGLGLRDRHIQTAEGSDKNPNCGRKWY